MREHLDKYYTKSEFASKCCQVFANKIDIDFENDMIVEPSAGDGSFIPSIKKLCKNSVFFDIDPEHKDIKKKDFLKTTKKDICEKKNINKIHVIGNPPFGFKSSNAIAFIKHVCTFCDTFCFILPKSFKKSSMKKSIPLNFHMIHSFDLPQDAFRISNNSYNVNCVCQIWKKRKTLRKTLPRQIPINYSFTKNPINADIAIRRVGYYTGCIYKSDLENKNKNSHYFVKLNNEPNLYSLSRIDLKSNNDVTGPKSISKQDIIVSLNKVVKKIILTT
jgi:predicted RNA methylase